MEVKSIDIWPNRKVGTPPIIGSPHRDRLRLRLVTEVECSPLGYRGNQVTDEASQDMPGQQREPLPRNINQKSLVPWQLAASQKNQGQKKCLCWDSISNWWKTSKSKLNQSAFVSLGKALRCLHFAEEWQRQADMLPSYACSCEAERWNQYFLRKVSHEYIWAMLIQK